MVLLGLMLSISAMMQYSIWSYGYLPIYIVSLLFLWLDARKKMSRWALRITVLYLCYLVTTFSGTFVGLALGVDLNIFGRILNHLLIIFTCVTLICRFVIRKNRHESIIGNDFCGLVQGALLGYFLLILAVISHYLMYETYGVDLFTEARSSAHTREAGQRVFIRATGFIREPSFAVPFIFDFMVYACIALRNSILKMAALTLACLAGVLISSPAFYLTLLVILGALMAMNFPLKYSAWLKVSSAMVFIVAAGVVTGYFFTDQLGYNASRIGSFFSQPSARKDMLLGALDLMSNANGVSNWIFGRGFSGFESLEVNAVDTPSGSIFHSSPNNLWVHLLFNSGIVGLIFYVAFLFNLVAVKYCKMSNIATVFLAVFLSASMYRSDFVSLRFGLNLAIMCIYFQWLRLGKILSKY